MTKIEEYWLEFEARTLPAAVPPMPRYALTLAYARGAYDMLCAVNAMEAKTPAEAKKYLHELELFVRAKLDEPRPGALQ
jgi:hypothetical protein